MPVTKIEVEVEILSATEVHIDWTAVSGDQRSRNGFFVSITPAWRDNTVFPKEVCTHLNPGVSVRAPSHCDLELDPGTPWNIEITEPGPQPGEGRATFQMPLLPPMNVVAETVWTGEAANVAVSWDPPEGHYSWFDVFLEGPGESLERCEPSRDLSCTFRDVAPGSYEASVRSALPAGNMFFQSELVTVGVKVVEPLAEPTNPQYRWRATESGNLILSVDFTEPNNATNQTSYVIESRFGSCDAEPVGANRHACEIDVPDNRIKRGFPATFSVTATAGDRTSSTSFKVGQPQPQPRTPENPVAKNITQSSATIQWGHDDRNTDVVFYRVWLSGGHASTCEVKPTGGAFTSVVSCSLAGLKANTSYTANVFAQDNIGQRSETTRVKFQTAEVPVKKTGCEEGGRHHNRLLRATANAERKYGEAVTKWTKRLGDKPNKLARKLDRLEAKRDKRISKAERGYDSVCPNGPFI